MKRILGVYLRNELRADKSIAEYECDYNYPVIYKNIYHIKFLVNKKICVLLII